MVRVVDIVMHSVELSPARDGRPEAAVKASPTFPLAFKQQQLHTVATQATDNMTLLLPLLCVRTIATDCSILGPSLFSFRDRKSAMLLSTNTEAARAPINLTLKTFPRRALDGRILG